jgi:kynurenine 3-monooxygenase
MTHEPVTIVGAGLGGALMAALLAQDGHRVTVYERRPDPRRAGADTGRSINLAISARGLHALDQAGLTDQVRAMAIPMRGRMIHDAAGALSFQAYGARGEAINSISRADLNLLLLDAAERAGATLIFQHRCLDLDFEAGTLDLLDLSASREVRVAAAMVIGADGAFSAVRARMQRQDRFDYSQSYLEHGYKELCIPPAADGRFRLEAHALHIWPRGGYMMIALPNRDGSFTCTLFWPFHGPDSFASVQTPDDLTAFFRRTYPDALSLMPTLVEDFFANPTGSLVTVRCAPWHVEGRAVLIGDAAHAVVPFYGQGANASFEDCVLLRDSLRAHPADRARALAEFSRGRRPHADALAELAIDNFVEMRDRVAHPGFLLRKKWEHLLARVFPRWYLPLYTMVSFSRIPYADAVARSKRQGRWVLAVLGILAGLGVLAIWEAASRR